jgi:hypothetical protein
VTVEFHEGKPAASVSFAHTRAVGAAMLVFTA